jgi:F0F1-type ATP synthase assembly protein I
MHSQAHSAELSKGPSDPVFSTNDKRAMNQGFGDGMSRAFELVATPLVFGGIGYLVDRAAGTVPVFAIVLGAFGIVGTFVRAWYGYDAEMRRVEQTGRWNRSADDPEPEPVSDLWTARRERAS